MLVKLVAGAIVALALACGSEAQAGHRRCGHRPLARLTSDLCSLTSDLRPARRAVRATRAIVHRLVHPRHHRGRCR